MAVDQAPSVLQEVPCFGEGVALQRLIAPSAFCLCGEAPMSCLDPVCELTQQGHVAYSGERVLESFHNEAGIFVHER